jgi:hypothetical protein
MAIITNKVNKKKTDTHLIGLTFNIILKLSFSVAKIIKVNNLLLI